MKQHTANFENVAYQYQYDLKKMKNELEKLEHSIAKTVNKFGKAKNEPSFLDKLIPRRQERRMEQFRNEYKNLTKKWQDLTGGTYPQVKTDEGKEVFVEDFYKEVKICIDSKDGYYHIPDQYLKNDFMKEISDGMEEVLKRRNTGIPMDIGLKLQKIFEEPGTTWIHRTQIDIEHENLLKNIAVDGLICNANDLENTATPFSQFPIFLSQTVYSCSYRNDTCKGAIIIKTNGEPDISNKRLNPNQIIGYVGCDDGRLHDFISKNEMSELTAEINSFQTSKDKLSLDDLIHDVKENIIPLPDRDVSEHEFDDIAL